jgi:hypothetical protein
MYTLTINFYYNIHQLLAIQCCTKGSLKHKSIHITSRVIWFQAITILQSWRNAITIPLIGNFPLQFFNSHKFALFYVCGGLRPTCRLCIYV